MGKAPLTFDQEGSDGVSVARHVIHPGQTWVHMTTKGRYTVVGFEWDAERDLWMVKYRSDSGSPGPADGFVRSIPNFLEKFAHSVGRA